MESNYSLINADRALLAASFGADCVSAGISVIPDVYKTGLAGACRVHPTSTTCSPSPPGHPSLSWTALFSSDLLLASTAPNTTTSPDTIAHCLDLIASAPVNHAHNDRLAAALLALLAFSAVLNVAATLVALFRPSAFCLPVFFPALVDEVLLVAAGGVYLGILNHEVGPYIVRGHAVDGSVHVVDGGSVLGIGFWLLLSVLAVRVVSMPALVVGTVGTVGVVIAVPVLVVCLVCSCICCSDSVSGPVQYVEDWGGRWVRQGY